MVSNLMVVLVWIRDVSPVVIQNTLNHNKVVLKNIKIIAQKGVYFKNKDEEVFETWNNLLVKVGQYKDLQPQPAHPLVKSFILERQKILKEKSTLIKRITVLKKLRT